MPHVAVSIDDPVAGVDRVEELIDAEIVEASLMLAAAALKALTAEDSFVCCSELGVGLSRILANMLLVLLDPGGTEGLFVILTAN